MTHERDEARPDDPRRPAPDHGPRDEDTLEDRTQEIRPEHTDVLVDPHHDEDTAAEAAEQADPGVTGADPGA